MNIFSALAYRYYAFRRYYFLAWLPFFAVITALHNLGRDFQILRDAAIGFSALSGVFLGAYEYRKVRKNYYAFRPSSSLFYASGLIFFGINAVLQSAGMLAFLLAGEALSGNELLLPFVFLASLFTSSFSSLLASLLKIFGYMRTYIWLLVLGAAAIAFTNKERALLEFFDSFFAKRALFLKSFPVLLLASALSSLLLFLHLNQEKK